MNINNVPIVGQPIVAGANGPMTYAECFGNPNIYALDVNVYAVGCLLSQVDNGTKWTNTGTLAAPAWTQANFATVQTFKTALTSAQILALNTTPITLLTAAPAGYVWDVISVVGEVVYNSAAYATHTELDIVDGTTGDVLFKDTATLLAATATTVAQIPANINSNAGIAITAGGTVQAKAASGNPATGNSPVNVYVTAKLVQL